MRRSVVGRHMRYSRNNRRESYSCDSIATIIIASTVACIVNPPFIYYSNCYPEHTFLDEVSQSRSLESSLEPMRLSSF